MTTDGSFSDRDAVAPAPKRSRLFRRLLILAAAAIAVVAVLTAVDIARVVHELHAGRDAFSALADAGFAEPSRLHPLARHGADRFGKADRVASGSRWIAGAARLPLIGRPAAWLRSAAHSAATIGRQAAGAVGRIEPRLDAAADPRARLALLDAFDTELTRLHALVSQVRLPPPGFLPPVANADRELRADLRRLRRALADGAMAARGLRSFLAGPTTYVVLASNGAEMRAGGMVLQVGSLTASNATLTAGEFRSTGELILKTPIALPPEIETLYGWLDPDTEWRNVGSSPNFPVVAPLYATMAERTGFGRPDGVLQIDVAGMRALLEAIGPVTVSGRRYDSSNVEQLVMHDLYHTYRADVDERHSEFSRLASAAFRALSERRWRLGDLESALRTAAAGRHVLAWSRRADEQRAWERLGVDGALDPDGMMVTVQNHTGNKLDWYVQPAVTLRLEEPPGRLRRVHARIRIDNLTPLHETPYISGDGTLVPRGTYRGFVAIYLPRWATNVGLSGGKVIVTGTDGPMRVVATRLDIPRFGSATIEVVFSVPSWVARMVLLPSARAHRVPFRLAATTVVDDRRRVLPLRAHAS